MTSGQLSDDTQPSSTLHEPFLERAAGSAPGGGGHALGAFLAMRLADQFAWGANPVQEEALGFQISSTADYLERLEPRTVEVGHLQEIVRIAAVAHELAEPRMLFPPLLAFAYWLEQEHRLRESEDVLVTARKLSDGRDAEEELATELEYARVVRKLSQYPAAIESYRRAEGMARRFGDSVSERRARIGQGIVFTKTGDLPQAEQVLSAVIREAAAAGDTDSEARARHDLSNVLMIMCRPAAAVPEAFRAFETYDGEQQRIRALGDLGMAFKMLDNHRAAEDAFAIVLGSEACTTEIRINTMLELMEVATRTGDRVSFERWRRQLDDLADVMRPDAQVDYCIKAGTGWTVFGHPDRGLRLLDEGIQLAEAHGLNAYLFHAEDTRTDVAGRVASTHLEEEGPRGRSPNVWLDAEDGETDRVAGRLHALRAGAGRS